MKARIINVWTAIQTSYWFVPVIMVTGSIFLAFLTLELDRGVISPGKLKFDFLNNADADGARDVLSTIANSMITAASVSFSMTLVALSLASSQYGPRLLRTFMQNEGNQFVLGTFVSTYAYSLVILRTISTASASSFVPHLSVTVAFLLAMCSLGVFIYFIHHISSSLNADFIISEVGKVLDRRIETHFLSNNEKMVDVRRSEGDVLKEVSSNNQLTQTHICSRSSGYIQAISHEEQINAAYRAEGILHCTASPGEHVVEGQQIATLFSRSSLEEEESRKIAKTFIIGRERTEEQDILFPIKQLSEIAVRSLSPGINDPYTAIRCIDRLLAAHAKILKTPPPSPFRYDQDGELRCILTITSVSTMLENAFSVIQESACSHAKVLIRLLGTYAYLSELTTNPDVLESLRDHATITNDCLRKLQVTKQQSKSAEESWQKLEEQCESKIRRRVAQ